MQQVRQRKAKDQLLGIDQEDNHWEKAEKLITRNNKIKQQNICLRAYAFKKKKREVKKQVKPKPEPLEKIIIRKPPVKENDHQISSLFSIKPQFANGGIFSLNQLHQYSLLSFASVNDIKFQNQEGKTRHSSVRKCKGKIRQAQTQRVSCKQKGEREVLILNNTSMSAFCKKMQKQSRRSSYRYRGITPWKQKKPQPVHQQLKGIVLSPKKKQSFKLNQLLINRIKDHKNQQEQFSDLKLKNQRLSTFLKIMAKPII